MRMEDSREIQLDKKLQASLRFVAESISNCPQFPSYGDSHQLIPGACLRRGREAMPRPRWNITASISLTVEERNGSLHERSKNFLGPPGQTDRLGNAATAGGLRQKLLIARLLRPFGKQRHNLRALLGGEFLRRGRQVSQEIVAAGLTDPSALFRSCHAGTSGG